MLTYVYCLVYSRARPSTRGVPAGLPGSSDLRMLDARKGLWAIVCSVPAAEYDEDALARGLLEVEWVGVRAMAHEAVVEHFLTAPALLPMQLFSLFSSDARVLDHVERDRSRIDAILARIAGQLEWGLRLTFDESAARAAVDSESERPATGAGYLQRKRELRDATRAGLVRAGTEADRLYRLLSRDASDARRRVATEQAVPGSRLLLDAAFLVPARRAASFRAALRRYAKSLEGTGVVISLTGPWPAYNFIAPPGGSAARSRGKRAARRAVPPAAAKRTVTRKRARR